MYNSRHRSHHAWHQVDSPTLLLPSHNSHLMPPPLFYYSPRPTPPQQEAFRCPWTPGWPGRTSSPSPADGGRVTCRKVHPRSRLGFRRKGGAGPPRAFSAMARKYLARKAPVLLVHTPDSTHAVAAATAACTSSGVAAGMEAMVSSVAGLTTGRRPPLHGVTHCPPMYS